MGDMADYTLEQLESEELYFDNCMIDEETGAYEFPYSRSTKTCRFCGRKDLHWEMRKKKWRLCDGRGVHRCPVKPLHER